MARKAHILKANKTGRIPRYRVYFDSESRVIDLVHHPYLVVGCIKDGRYEKERWKEYTENLEEFWHDCANFGGKRTSVTAYAHNAGYDLIVTKGIPTLLKLGFHVSNYFEKGTTFLMTFRKKETDQKTGKEQIVKTLHIISATNFYATTLKKLGEVFDLEKLDFDYDDGSIKDAIIYCRRDVEILKRAMETFINFTEAEDLGTLGRSTPGQSFNAYRHRFMHTQIFLHDKEEVFDLERKCYYGGRVECWRIGKYEEEEGFYGFDINSMYPHVMKANKFPCRLLSQRKRCSLPEMSQLFERGYLVCGEFIVNVDRPVFPCKLEGNLIFPVGRFKTYLSTPEIIYGIENNLIEKVGHIAIYEGADLFSGYVDYFYKERLKAKEIGNRVNDLLYKLFMNSLYGKFGQKAENWRRLGDAPPEQIGAWEVYNIDEKRMDKYKAFGGSLFKQEEETEAFNSFCAVAAHVTAYARMCLLEFIEKIGWDNILYMDTDSLFVNKAGAANLEGEISDTDLGKMKLEKTGKVIEIYSPKDYSFAGKIKRKGVKQGSLAVTDPQQLSQVAEKMKMEVDEIKDAVFENEQWPRLNTFIRAGQLDRYYNVKPVKVLTRKYNKGWITESGKVLPFEIEVEEGENYIIPYQDTSYIIEDKFLLDWSQVDYIEKRYRKTYGIYSADKCEQDQLFKIAKEQRREFRSLILSMGGIRDPDFEYLPRWCKRKKGFTLGEIAQELQDFGYHLTENELYELLQQ